MPKTGGLICWYFSGAPTKRPHLTDLAVDLTHNRGLVTVASVLPTGSRSADQKDTLVKEDVPYLVCSSDGL